MRKILVIARREYLAAVRTKTFIISLLVMPLLMGGSAVFSLLLKDMVDTRDRHFVIVDRSQGQKLLAEIKNKLTKYNSELTEGGEQVKPRFLVEVEPPSGATEEAQKQQRFLLSERVRSGELMGFLEILDQMDRKQAAPFVLRYQTNRSLYKHFLNFMILSAGKTVQQGIQRETQLNDRQLEILVDPVEVKEAGLMQRDPRTGALKEADRRGLIAATVLPLVLMILMFSVVFMAAGPLLQSVVEEKMQRIAEVLLGSVRPFQLMMGKLLGMVCVSLTIEAVYLTCLYLAAVQWGFADYIPLDLIAWFFVFQVLSALMYGSLFIAVGAVCTDMKDTQNLLLPVVLLATSPFFLLLSIMQEPNSPLATALSFFPFATPTLMIARHSVPPGVPLWQALAGVAVVLATMLARVWAAGRLFRIGLLLQGKPPRLRDLFRWVLRG